MILATHLRESNIFLQSGQIGNFPGSRPGTQTFPHKAITGLPVTALSTIFLFAHSAQIFRDPRRHWFPGFFHQAGCHQVSLGYLEE